MLLLLVVTSVAYAQITYLDKRPSSSEYKDKDIVYWSEVKTQPRPMKIYCIRYKLSSSNYKLDVAVPPKVTKQKEEETSLLDPMKITKKNDLICAINTNAFGPIPGLFNVRTWYEGKPVEIIGWAKNPEKEFSPAQKHYYSFWLDKNGVPYMGNIKESQEGALLAVAGFNSLIKDGKITASQKGKQPKHPRTMIGFDKDKAFLYLVVVDGRQAGISEGMTSYEQAAFMKELDCWDALNLDGGGSSIIIGQKSVDDKPELTILNTPSDSPPRPVAVMLGIKEKD